MPLSQFVCYIPHQEALEYVANALSTLVMPGEVIALSGDLGAGKTTLVREFARCLGVDPLEVTSPTFTILQTYQGEKYTIYHFDAYRLQDAEAFEREGFAECFDDKRGIVAIEWSEIIREALPSHCWFVHIEKSRLEENIRRMTITMSRPDDRLLALVELVDPDVLEIKGQADEHFGS